MNTTLHEGDCLDVMRGLAADSIESCVTDPPYHLQSIVKRFGAENAAPAKGGVYARSSAGFMGKTWDGGDIAFRVELWAEVLRVLKPGAHLVAFSGSRTYHRMACAIEDAGFEIRDQIMWLYGSGFPKSHDVGKGFDKAAGAEREVVGVRADFAARANKQRVGVSWADNSVADGSFSSPQNIGQITAPATDAARQWDGWGTALKPAHEPIVLARKPLVGTVAGNIAAHGTGAINVEACRVVGGDAPAGRTRNGGGSTWDGSGFKDAGASMPAGRWPANVCHDGSDEVMEAFAAFGERTAGRFPKNTGGIGTSTGIYGKATGRDQCERELDAGTAARFFYEAKASKAERGAGNTHPTVKPLALMRWLCRLITPPGGTVLDPFLGSGSTAIAADQEGFHCIGIEREAEYMAIARARLTADAPLFCEVA